jgi:hypothetical protein
LVCLCCGWLRWRASDSSPATAELYATDMMQGGLAAKLGVDRLS